MPRRGKAAGERRFTIEEDRLARRIARSEKKTHPDYSYARRLAIGYGVVQKRRRMERQSS